jgi:hypothetical protein
MRHVRASPSMALRVGWLVLNLDATKSFSLNFYAHISLYRLLAAAGMRVGWSIYIYSIYNMSDHATGTAMTQRSDIKVGRPSIRPTLCIPKNTKKWFSQFFVYITSKS